MFFPFCPYAGEGAPSVVVLRDEAAGYVLPLPPGWRELAGPDQLRDLIPRVCVLFSTDGGIPGSSSLRGAVLPDEAAASPALIVFALDYALLGLDSEAAREIAKDSRSVTATPANALQESYLRLFPRSIRINHHLGENFFSLNLRRPPLLPAGARASFPFYPGSVRGRGITRTSSMRRVETFSTRKRSPRCSRTSPGSGRCPKLSSSNPATVP